MTESADDPRIETLKTIFRAAHCQRLLRRDFVDAVSNLEQNEKLVAAVECAKLEISGHRIESVNRSLPHLVLTDSRLIAMVFARQSEGSMKGKNKFEYYPAPIVGIQVSEFVNGWFEVSTRENTLFRVRRYGRLAPIMVNSMRRFHEQLAQSVNIARD
jgi:hypothetical protein